MPTEAFGGIIGRLAWGTEAACQVGHDQRASGQDTPDRLSDETLSGLVADLANGLENAVETGRDFFQQDLLWHRGPPLCLGHVTTHKIGTSEALSSPAVQDG